MTIQPPQGWEWHQWIATGGEEWRRDTRPGLRLSVWVAESQIRQTVSVGWDAYEGDDDEVWLAGGHGGPDIDPEDEAEIDRRLAVAYAAADAYATGDGVRASEALSRTSA